MDNGGVGDAGSPIDGGDWRAQLRLESRERIVIKLMGTLERHLPVSGPEGFLELRNIAVRNIAVMFEEEIYAAAISESDYVRKIASKMLTMETKSQSTIPRARL